MADSGYQDLLRFFEDISGSASVDALDTQIIPVVGRELDTIYIQRIMADVVTAGVAGAKWTVTDTNATVLTSDIPADVEGPILPRDFSAKGRALKEGEGLLLALDAGATGIITWEGYRKRTGVGAA